MAEDTIDAPALAHAPWPRLDDPGAIADAWRQAHHGAQAAAELGKSWAEARGDDSHSTLAWDDGDGSLAGVEVGGARAALRFEPFGLRVGGADGHDDLPLHGVTADEAEAWVRRHAEARLGPARRDARPAPDLPEHPVAAGRAFDASDAGAFALVGRLYGAANAALCALAGALPDRPAVRCWPHHFDIATLHLASPDGSRTVGAGLAVPDGVAPSGYLYVSAWARDGAPDPARLAPDLRWAGAMAVLPLDALAEPDDARRAAGVGEFVARAFGACLGAFRG